MSAIQEPTIIIIIIIIMKIIKIIFFLSFPGHTISRVLQTLEVLDRHCFDRCDASNSIDALYNKIFLNNQKQEAPEVCLTHPSSVSSFSPLFFGGRGGAPCMYAYATQAMKHKHKYLPLLYQKQEKKS